MIKPINLVIDICPIASRLYKVVLFVCCQGLQVEQSAKPLYWYEQPTPPSSEGDDEDDEDDEDGSDDASLLSRQAPLEEEDDPAYDPTAMVQLVL